MLYAKTDPLIDVVIPAYTLMSHCIIDFVKENKKSKNPDFLYGFPGLTAFEATKIGDVYDKLTNNSGGYERDYSSQTTFNSKVMSLYIDGVVNLNLAMIKNITPTFSKHTAKSSYVSKTSNGNNGFTNNEFEGDYPIYAELNLQIESLIPADSNMLWQGALIHERNKAVVFGSSANSSVNSINTDTQPTGTA